MISSVDQHLQSYLLVALSLCYFLNPYILRIGLSSHTITYVPVHSMHSPHEKLEEIERERERERENDRKREHLLLCLNS
jgi:hypothetical protein